MLIQQTVLMLSSKYNLSWNKVYYKCITHHIDASHVDLLLWCSDFYRLPLKRAKDIQKSICDFAESLTAWVSVVIAWVRSWVLLIERNFETNYECLLTLEHHQQYIKAQGYITNCFHLEIVKKWECFILFSQWELKDHPRDFQPKTHRQCISLSILGRLWNYTCGNLKTSALNLLMNKEKKREN